MPAGVTLTPPRARGVPDSREFGDTDASRDMIFQRVLDSASQVQPISNKLYSLGLSDVGYEGPENYNLAAQKRAILEGRTLGRRLRGNWTLSDVNTGQPVDQRRVTLANIPYMTQRGTYILNGVEYGMNHQMRLRPGIFTRVKESGELESHVNVAKGFGHRYFLDPATGVFRVQFGQARMPLMPLLKALGATETQIRNSWGNELYVANKQKDEAVTLKKLAMKLKRSGQAPSDPASIRELILSTFAEMEMDPEVTQRTLGKGYDKVTPDAVLAATQKLLRVMRDEEQPDDRDSMVFQRTLGPEDVFAERIGKGVGEMRRILWKATIPGNLQKMVPGTFDKVVRGALLDTGLGNTLEEINPAELVDQGNRITRMGEGGIESSESVPDEARNVQPSQLGFIDPSHTPECYDEQTEVMTWEGWTPWPSVTEADRLACFVNGALQYHRAERIIVSDYCGEMYGARSAVTEYLVTPNHRLWVRPLDEGSNYRIETAAEAWGRSRKVRAGGHGAYCGDSDLTYFELPAVPQTNATKDFGRVAIADWCEFMGWWLSEGSCSYCETTSTYQVKVSQSRTANPENCQLIETMWERLGWRWCYTSGDYVVSGRRLAAYLTAMGLSHEKHIPEELLHAPEPARQRLFESLIRGDGRKQRGRTPACFCSTSQQLADDFQRLAFGLGLSTRTVFEPDAREQSNHGGCWVVHVHFFSERDFRRKMTAPDSGYFKQHYEGKVYCATVPGGLLYIRRHEKGGHWSGNSGKIGIDTRISRMTRLGRDGRLYSRFKNTRSGRTEWRSPQDLADKTVSFPLEMESEEDHVRAIVGGKLRFVPKGQVDYQLSHMSEAFGPLSNMVPFKSAVFPQRASMGSRMITQALPLVKGEAPLVQSGIPGESQSFEESFGKQMGAIRSDTDGTVVSVSPEEIVVRGTDRKLRKIETYDNFPYNRKSVTGSTRVVVFKATLEIQELAISDYVFEEGDRVLSIDPETKQSAWQLITGFIRHENDKQLLRVKTASGRFVDVTEDHSLVTIGAAGELTPLYPADCVVNATRLPIATWAPALCDPQEQWQALLAGLYLAEGHLPEQSGMVMLAVEPDDRAEQILELLREAGLSPYRSGGNVCFTEPTVREWLLTHFGKNSGGKFIHPSVLGWSTNSREDLIAGYMAGDGNLWADSNGAIQVTGVSTSLRLRDGLVNVLASLGIFTTLFDAPRQHLNPAWNDAWGFRVISGHLSKLSCWFFYVDRQALLEDLLKDTYRASPFELVPIVGKACRKTLYQEFQDVPPYIYKTAHQGAVAKHRLEACDGSFGAWGRSDVMWDTVVAVEPLPHEAHVYDFQVDKSEVFAVNSGLVVHNTFVHNTAVVQPGQKIKEGDLLARSNYTDGQGVTALGKNARVAYIPYKGFNYEDAIVISESFAKGTSSEHLYQNDLDIEEGIRPNKNAFTAIFPGKHDRKLLERYDEDGVIEVGATVNMDEPLILAVRQRKTGPQLGRRKRSYADASVAWDHHTPGVVTDVFKGKNAINVVVKSTQQTEVGDKFAGRYGDKGVVAAIVPDDEMPRDDQNLPYEVLLNPLGIISRGNPAQVIEAALGKIAVKTGKPFKMTDFDDLEDLRQFAIKQLQKHGLKSTVSAFDPSENRAIANVMDGNRFLMKLHHTAEAKLQGRAAAGAETGYTSEETPAKGGETGAKRVGMLELNALLSHGAYDVVRDTSVIRGQKNEDYWRQVMSGYTPPNPQVPYVYKKFVAELQAAGINPLKTGTTMNIMAMTQKNVQKLTGDREIRVMDKFQTVDWKSPRLTPKQGGLFDEALTGGHGGNRWAHIKLREPLLNPIMEEPARRLLGLTVSQIRDVISGKECVRGFCGPDALAKAFANFDIDTEIKRAETEIKGTRKGARDMAVRRLGYLKQAKKTGQQPKDWILDRVPVLPPMFRPISLMQQTKQPLVSDANYLYKEVFDATRNLKAMAGRVDDLSAERMAVYDAFRGVVGLGNPLHPKHQEQKVRGVLKHIFGPSPKFGTVQRKLLGSTVDLVGRATITPNPNLDMDQVGLPLEKAWEVYSPFVVRRLVRRGMPKLQAMQQVTDRSGSALKELMAEMEVRPVVASRAPTIHKFGVMAFWPQVSESDTLEIPPIVTGGFGADFDGDAMNFHVPGTKEAIGNAIEQLLPSRNLLSASDFGVHYTPTQEYLGGLWAASAHKDLKKPIRTYKSKSDAIRAYRRGEIGVGQRIEIVE